MSATDPTAPPPFPLPPAAARLLAAALAVALPIGALLLADRPGGRALGFALLLGAAFGVVLQRARFCFFCHARDYFERRDGRGLRAILLALAVGTVGMHVVLSGWLPVPEPGRLPPDAHIGPVSWALVLAGLVFGLGMVISGACLSAHWYRLAEGSPVAPFALLGAAAGFVLGFNTWNPLYSATIATAPAPWLPHWLGYLGSALLTLALLGALAAWLWHRAPPAAPAAALPASLRGLLARCFSDRWPYWLGGALVGWIAVLIVLRLRPLGVTAALGAAAREGAASQGWIPARLDGLDALGGCATAVADAWWRTPNALLIAGLVTGAWAAALASGQFTPRRPRPADAWRGLGGGLLLGWGAMTALGCTVGTLLSGSIAGALSGWVFGAAVLASVWAGLKLGWAR